MTTITVAEAYQTRIDDVLTTPSQRVTSIEKQNENWYRLCTVVHPHGFSVDKDFVLHVESETELVSRRCVVCGAPIGDMAPKQQKRCYAHQRQHIRERIRRG